MFDDICGGTKVCQLSSVKHHQYIQLFKDLWRDSMHRHDASRTSAGQIFDYVCMQGEHRVTVQASVRLVEQADATWLRHLLGHSYPLLLTTREE